MTIYTIGYEGINVDGFVSCLQRYNIETVVDVRELPLSRKRGFSKTALADTLSLWGFEYVHLHRLGCPKPIRDRYRVDGNWKLYRAAFLKYLDTSGEALRELATIARSSNCVLLCFEADHNYCHRSMVAEAVKRLAGMRVCHIQVAELRKAHSAGLVRVAA
jgi:uncharacterized protein (DUF488 family)